MVQPSHANFHHHMVTHDNDYVEWEDLDIAGASTVNNKYQDRMKYCKGYKCAYYFYDIDGKYALCEFCRGKEMC